MPLEPLAFGLCPLRERCRASEDTIVLAALILGKRSLRATA